MDTLMQAKPRIETEFDEPLCDVVSGFVEMGYSRTLIADTLEVTVPSLRKFAKVNGIRFNRRPIEHREIRGRPGRRIRHAGREMSLTGWAQELGVSPCTIHKRLRTRGSVA